MGSPCRARSPMCRTGLWGGSSLTKAGSVRRMRWRIASRCWCPATVLHLPTRPGLPSLPIRSSPPGPLFCPISQKKPAKTTGGTWRIGSRACDFNTNCQHNRLRGVSLVGIALCRTRSAFSWKLDSLSVYNIRIQGDWCLGRGNFRKGFRSFKGVIIGPFEVFFLHMTRLTN